MDKRLYQTALDSFTIVIPTYKEADNIAALVTRIGGVDFGSRVFDVLLVDDNSQDGTADIVQNLQCHYPWLRMITRHAPKDLSQSMIMGFNNAQHSIIVTMDADLSHPVEKLPMMLNELLNADIDMVVGSRYVKGGSSDTKWPLIRKMTSQTAAMIARVLLRMPIRDPLSGFIAFRKSILQRGNKLEPIGWKVGLEVMIKCHCRHIVEVPIHFSERERGFSKLNIKISLDYLRHVIALMKFRATHQNQ